MIVHPVVRAKIKNANLTITRIARPKQSAEQAFMNYLLARENTRENPEKNFREEPAHSDRPEELARSGSGIKAQIKTGS